MPILSSVKSLFERFASRKLPSAPAAEVVDTPISTAAPKPQSPKSNPISMSTKPKIIRNLVTDLCFIEGKGFTGTPKTATLFECYDDAEDVRETICANSRGLALADTTIENAPASLIKNKVKSDPIQQNKDGSSWAVRYIRKAGAKDRPQSGRRFRTRDEARMHGTRFVKLKGHIGFKLEKVKEPVNAWVNKKTGLTNPAIGKAAKASV